MKFLDEFAKSFIENEEEPAKELKLDERSASARFQEIDTLYDVLICSHFLGIVRMKGNWLKVYLEL